MRSPIEKFLQIAIIPSFASAGDSSAEILLAYPLQICFVGRARPSALLFCRTKFLPKAYPELFPLVNWGKSYNFCRKVSQLVTLVTKRPSGGMVSRDAGDLAGGISENHNL
jgi:hypothetical protein